MPNNKESCHKEINSLFDEAKGELDKIDTQANERKKEIVIKLAKDLEDKIPIDTISSTIVKRLDGRVSEIFIHECLDEKYKQKYRMDNAKKQKKKKQEKEIILAPQPALNPQEYSEEEEEEEEKEEKQKNKVAVMVGADGRSYIQREEDKESSKTAAEDHADSTSKDKVFTQSSSSQQQEEHQFKEDNDRLDGEPEDQSFNDLDDLNSDQEKILDKPNQLATTADKIMNTSGISSAASSFDNNNDKDILPFEF